MILFLTDGMPEDSTSDILEELASGQNLMVWRALFDLSLEVLIFFFCIEISDVNQKVSVFVTSCTFIYLLLDQPSTHINLLKETYFTESEIYSLSMFIHLQHLLVI